MNSFGSAGSLFFFLYWLPKFIEPMESAWVWFLCILRISWVNRVISGSRGHSGWRIIRAWDIWLLPSKEDWIIRSNQITTTWPERTRLRLLTLRNLQRWRLDRIELMFFLKLFVQRDRG